MVAMDDCRWRSDCCGLPNSSIEKTGLDRVKMVEKLDSVFPPASNGVYCGANGENGISGEFVLIDGDLFNEVPG